MTSKARRSLCPWVTCERCQVILSQKDVPIHEKNCPTEPVNQGFVKNGVFNCNVEIYKFSGKIYYTSYHEGIDRFFNFSNIYFRTS